MKTISSKIYVILFCSVLLTCYTSCSKDESVTPVESVDSDDSDDVIDNPEFSAIAEEILQLVNTHRKSIGKRALDKNTLATQLAEKHTNFMIGEQKISHDNFSDRADELIAKEKALRVGENVASRQRSAKEVVDAWLDSKGHRENIEGDFTHIGISAVKNSKGQYYFTQLFLKK